MENGVSSIHHKANAVGIGTFQCNRKIALRRNFRSGVVFASVGQCPEQTAERGYSSPHQYDILVALRIGSENVNSENVIWIFGEV
jgi:hypothetical protein